MSKFKKTFVLTHSNAAGIDIGASSHFVAVPLIVMNSPSASFQALPKTSMRWPIG